MKNGTKKKYLIILLIVLLLGLAVGYAIFSDTLTITGTANLSGNFDIQFVECQINDNSNGYDLTTPAPAISADGKTLTVTAKDLEYPGAFVQYDVKIQNKGTIPAVVKNFEKELVTGNEDNIEIVGVDGIPIDEILQPNAICNYSFYVRWKEDSDATSDEVSYNITIDYEQIQSETTPAETHSH